MKNNIFSKLFLVLAIIFLHVSCNDDDEIADDIIGLWQQERITEDGVDMPLTGVNEDVRLLIDKNGIYRSYAKNSPEVMGAGTWKVTDDKYLDISADLYQLNSANKWVSNHTIERFTVLTSSSTTLEIRVKTYVGRMKYSTLFAAKDLDIKPDDEDGNIVPDVTDEEAEVVRKEYEDIKTYIFTFKRK